MFISETKNTNLNNNKYYYNDTILSIPAIPVVENSRLGCGVVSFSNLNSIVEDYGCDYEDAFCAIAEENQIDPNSLAVSVEDWKLIESPELVNMIPNIVVKPISEDNIVYQAVDYCISNYCSTGNDKYLYNIIDEDGTFVQRHIKTGAKIGSVLGTLGGAYLGRKAGSIGSTAGGAAIGATLGGLTGGISGLEVAKTRGRINKKLYDINRNIELNSHKTIEDAKKKSPSWIAKKIAAIKQWILIKLGVIKDPKKQGIVNKIKNKLLGIINKLKEILHLKYKK